MRAALLWLAACGLSLSAPAIHAQASVEIRPVMTQGLSAQAIDTVMTEADAALAAQNYAAAHEKYRRVYFDNTDNASAVFGMAETLLGLGRYKDALIYYAKAPKTARSFAGMTLCNIALNNAGDSEVALNAALEINLTDTRLWIALGQYYDDQGRALEAKSTYVQALKYGADHSEITNHLGVSLLRAGRYDLALEKFQQANALSAGQAVFDNNRRLTLALMGDYDGAVLSISEARAASVYHRAGVVAARAGQNDIAQRMFTRALKISPVYYPPAQAGLDALKTAS